MITWWTSLNGSFPVFYAIAFVSTALLAVQLALNLFGLAGHDMATDVSAGPGFDTEVAMDHPELSTHSSGLGLISMRTVVAFFVGFGWAGVVFLTANRSVWLATLSAFIVGVVFMFVVFFLMRSVLRLSESGNIDFRNSVGQTGTVYTTVRGPGKGPGQVQVVVQGRLREMAAVSQDGTELSPGTPIRVTKMISGSIVEVQKLEVK